MATILGSTPEGDLVDTGLGGDPIFVSRKNRDKQTQALLGSLRAESDDARINQPQLEVPDRPEGPIADATRFQPLQTDFGPAPGPNTFQQFAGAFSDALAPARGSAPGVALGRNLAESLRAGGQGLIKAIQGTNEPQLVADATQAAPEMVAAAPTAGQRLKGLAGDLGAALAPPASQNRISQRVGELLRGGSKFIDQQDFTGVGLDGSFQTDRFSGRGVIGDVARAGGVALPGPQTPTPRGLGAMIDKPIVPEQLDTLKQFTNMLEDQALKGGAQAAAAQAGGIGASGLGASLDGLFSDKRLKKNIESGNRATADFLRALGKIR